MYPANIAPHALVIDSDELLLKSVSNAFREDGWVVQTATTIGNLLEVSNQWRWDAVFCDLPVGEQDPFRALRLFAETAIETKLILMTAAPSAAGVLEATAFGAYDY